MVKSDPYPLILASTSKYRQSLLRQLGLSFSAHPPEIDEERVKLEIRSSEPTEIAEELARRKAESLITSNTCVIGGDQLISLGGSVLGKPLDRVNAIEMLEKLQGQTHQLITSICVLCRGETTIITDVAQMRMKKLTLDQIHRYVDFEKPFDCAGSYKIESRGIALFSKIECDDFTAIQGIPLMKLASLLQNYNYEIP